MHRCVRSLVPLLLLAAAACSGSSGTTAATNSQGSRSASSVAPGPAAAVAAGQCWSAPIAEPAAASGPSAFEDITDATNLTSPLLGMMGHAVAVGDVNGDGLVDLFVGGFADRPEDDYAVRGADGPAPDRLLLGGANGFTLDDGFPGTKGRTSSAAFVDLDNDGRPDLVVGRNNFEQRGKNSATDIQRAPTTAYRNDGDGRFTDMGPVGAPEFARAVTAFDYDDDGTLDLLIGQDGEGAPRLLHNDGNFKFSDITAKTGLPSQLIAFGITAADLNGDGRTDLAIAGDNKIFVGTEDGKFRDVTPPDFAWETFGREDLVTGIAVGDLNRDGLPDLVVGHHFGSTIDKDERVPVRVFLNRGNDDSGAPQWDDVTEEAGVPGFATKSPQVEIQDFDNDGQPDVLVTASADSGQTPVILHNDGAQGDTDVPRFTASDGLGDPQYWVSGGVSDVDHDGRLDVFVVEFDANKPSRLFRTTGPSGHWLGVDLGGTPLGGVGSLVTVFKPGAERDADGLLGSAWVTASTGYGAGPEPIVHIGLGDITTVDVVVRAANGETTTMQGVTADQMVRPGGCGP